MVHGLDYGPDVPGERMEQVPGWSDKGSFLYGPAWRSRERIWSQGASGKKGIEMEGPSFHVEAGIPLRTCPTGEAQCPQGWEMGTRKKLGGGVRIGDLA